MERRSGAHARSKEKSTKRTLHEQIAEYNRQIPGMERRLRVLLGLAQSGTPQKNKDWAARKHTLIDSKLTQMRGRVALLSKKAGLQTAK